MVEIKLSEMKDWETVRTPFLHSDSAPTNLYPSFALSEHTNTRARVCATKTFIIESINREKIK